MSWISGSMASALADPAGQRTPTESGLLKPQIHRTQRICLSLQPDGSSVRGEPCPSRRMSGFPRGSVDVGSGVADPSTDFGSFGGERRRACADARWRRRASNGIVASGKGALSGDSRAPVRRTESGRRARTVQASLQAGSPDVRCSRARCKRFRSAPPSECRSTRGLCKHRTEKEWDGRAERVPLRRGCRRVSRYADLPGEHGRVQSAPGRYRALRVRPDRRQPLRA
jgi:hypothetical protein